MVEQRIESRLYRGIKNSTYLTSKTIEEQKEEQEHNACPFGARLFSIHIKVKCQFIRRRHEHGNTNTDENCHNVVILRI